MMEETPRSLLRDVDPSTLWVAYGFALKDSQARRQAADGQATSRQAEREAPEGYAYIFPKQDHVNVGIGYVLSYFKDSVDQAPYELQRAFVGRLRSRGVVAGDSVRANFTPFQIPVGGPLRRPGRGRILLVGDAGGFVNGFTAEGIYYAMVSGELAAKTIARSWPSTAADLSEPYRRAVDQEMGPELRDSVLVQRYLFGDRRRIAAAIAAAPHQGSMTKLVLDLAIGRRSYAARTAPDVRSSADAGGEARDDESGELGSRLLNDSMTQSRLTYASDQAHEIQAHPRAAARDVLLAEADSSVRRASQHPRPAGQGPQRRLHRHRPGSHHRRHLLRAEAARITSVRCTATSASFLMKGRRPAGDDVADVRQDDRPVEGPRLGAA